MKIDLTKINKKDIESLLLEKEMNIASAQALFDYCFNRSALHKKYVQTVAEAWSHNKIKTYNDLEDGKASQRVINNLILSQN